MPMEVAAMVIMMEVASGGGPWRHLQGLAWPLGWPESFESFVWRLLASFFPVAITSILVR
jgi:hypothetical protein